MFSSEQTSILETSQQSSSALTSLATLEHVWRELTSERCKVVGSGVTDQVHYFELAAVNPSGPRVLTSKKLQLLSGILLGHRQKAFAIDANCALSTVTVHLGDCLQAFGLHRCSKRLPLLLVLMVHALHGKVPRDCVKVEHRADPAGDRWFVHCHRPETWLAPTLSEGELAVITHRVHGKTYAEIALQRGTSTRTVANQIASAYAKLRVSGRSELLCYLASRFEMFAGAAPG